MRNIGKAELLKKILPTLDEFELAINSLQSSSEAEHTVKGLELIYSNLLETLKAEGLAQIDTNGPYDPYKHEILMVRESGEDDGRITDVVRKGYTFSGMLLRPSSVIISKKKVAEQEREKKDGK